MKLLLLSLVCFGTLGAQTLQETVDQAAASAVATFAARGLKPDRLAITAIDLSAHEHPASYRGNESFYPASVVKLFYLVAAQAAIESGKLQPTPEFERAMHDMITTSSNDATQLVFSALTGTTGGPELPEAELKPWMARREAVNRYFESLGFNGINVNQPTFAECPYGRERQARGPNWENNNRVTTEAVARLWLSIVSRQAVTPLRSDGMLRLLRRDPFAPEPKDEQATDFGAKALPAGSQYWSKAGWTDAVRHDSAWVRLPNGAEYILVAFTRGVSKNVDILPFIHGRIAAYFLKHAPVPDLLLTNGHIWTGNPAQPWTDRVAIRGDRIVALGANASAADRTIDLKGRMAVPGFIADRTQFIEGGLALLSVPLKGAAVRPVDPGPTPREYRQALDAALTEAARNGVTSIQDITLWPHWTVYESARDEARLTVRVYARTPMASWRRQADLLGRIGTGDDWLRLGGLVAFMDEWPEGKLRENVLAADAEGLQCSVHARGDRASHLALDYSAEAERENGPRDRRFRIEHAPPVVFGGDTVAPFAPLLGIYAAVTRDAMDGKKITVDEALRAYTTSAAFAEFGEREKGAIEPGKLADIVVLSDDLFTIKTERLRDVRVTLTLVGGKVVYTAN